MIPSKPERHFPMPLPEGIDGKDMWYTGGELHPISLAAAYRQGFFPWQGEPLGWCSPDPRFVINPENWHVSSSIRRELRKTNMKITLDQDPHAVVRGCMDAPRPDQDGTWLTAEMVDAYSDLASCGYMHSAEAYLEDELVGGLYGVLVGSIFVGDSMFSKVSGASKLVFTLLGEHLWKRGVSLIDCQVYSEYLERFGAKTITRREYFEKLYTFRDAKIRLEKTTLTVF